MRLNHDVKVGFTDKEQVEIKAILDKISESFVDMEGFEPRRRVEIIESNDINFKIVITKLFKGEKACFVIGGLLNWNKGDRKQCAEIIEIENKRTEWILTLEGVKDGYNFSTVPAEYGNRYAGSPALATV
jgi:hypothetical protein